MSKPPLILVSPNIESKGQEFSDLSLSLSARYQQALINAGGIPLTLPAQFDWREHESPSPLSLFFGG